MDEGLEVFLSFEADGFIAVVSCASYAYLPAVVVEDADDVIFFKGAGYAGYSYHQEAYGFLSQQGLSGTFIEMDGTLGEVLGVGNPFLEAADGLVGRLEACESCVAFAGEDVGEDIVLSSVGYDYGYAFVGYFGGDGAFGYHSSSAEGRPAGLDVVVDLVIAAYFGYEFGGWIGRISGVYSVDIAEDNEGVGVQHGGDEAA